RSFKSRPSARQTPLKYPGKLNRRMDCRVTSFLAMTTMGKIGVFTYFSLKRALLEQGFSQAPDMKSVTTTMMRESAEERLIPMRGFIMLSGWSERSS
ncbi:MAG: hypothetical protein LBI59_11110, partial [Candidatus Accumulibacter sp.]|nr:hypothetical protein [Accumulibacter sp.]